MKAYRILLIAALMLLAIFMLASCSEDGLTFNPDLDVITDETVDTDSTVSSIRDFTVNCVFDTALGNVTQQITETTVIFDVLPGRNSVFHGWYTNESFSGDPLSESATLSLTATILKRLAVNGTVTLYANLSELYAIKYELNGGRFVGQSGPATYAPGETRELPFNVEKDGASFAGWRVSTSGQIVNDLPTTLRGPVTLSAVWDDGVRVDSDVKNTVWKLSESEMFYDLDCYIVFAPDGTADIFSGSPGETLVNSGAVISLMQRMYAAYPHGGTHSAKDIASLLSYDCDTPYYVYENLAGGGATVTFNTEAYDINNSPLGRYYLLYAGDLHYTMKIDGNSASFSVEVPECVRFGGATYSLEDWVYYLSSVEDIFSIDPTEVTHVYGGTESVLFSLTKVCDRVTDLEIDVFSAYDAPDKTYLVDDYFVFPKGECYVLNGSSGIYPAFMRGGKITVMQMTGNLINIYLFKSHVYDDDVNITETADGTTVTLPAFIDNVM